MKHLNIKLPLTTITVSEGQISPFFSRVMNVHNILLTNNPTVAMAGLFRKVLTLLASQYVGSMLE